MLNSLNAYPVTRRPFDESAEGNLGSESSHAENQANKGALRSEHEPLPEKLDPKALSRQTLLIGIPLRVVNSRGQNHSLLFYSRLPPQEREFRIGSTIR